MKRILYITAFPPCQKTGGQQFSLNAIRELSQKYIIDVWYFAYPGHLCELKSNIDATKVEYGVASICSFQIQRFDFIKHFWNHPIFTRRFSDRVLHKIQADSTEYDILYFDFSQVALYSLYIQHPHKVLRMHDVMFQKYGRKNMVVEKWVTRTERRIVQSFEKVFVPSKKDADLLKQTYGVNAFYTNEYLKTIDFPIPAEQKKQFVFYGYWKRSENTEGLIWFIQRVLPLLNKSHSFVVIGDGLDTALKEEYLIPHKIEYLGFVGNPLDIIIHSSAVIVPLFQGAGIKVKVIDSFTTGTPVIGTDIAFEGLPEVENLSFNVNDEIAFASCINSFSPLSYEQKQKCAEHFNSIYNNHHLLEQIENYGGNK
ncbi:MAG: glycosyltransferase [Treponema sp.]|nr:glycosyltransferase [Treponema sp.]